MDNNFPVELSIVMPCLNEEATIAACIQKARADLKKMGVSGEIIVADNGSKDSSVEIAESLGVRVVHQPIRGYGAAYLAGIAAARGRYIVIGDSDNTYDFSELDKFLEPLRNGYELVMGTRLKGEILEGAMPWLHRYIGNPILTGILNILFRAGVSDAHCGMRAFTKEAYEKMSLRTTGMEFASEMVIKAAKAKLNITEVPITYYPREGESKLRSFRDGWRHLRFMLLYSPTHLFLIPGFILFLFGFIGTLLLLPRPLKIGGRFYDIHVMTLTSLLALLGFQVMLLGLYARTYAIVSSLERKDRLIEWIWKHFNLEKGCLLGAASFALGFIVDAFVAYKWVKSGFGALDEVRTALFALLLMALGAQIIFSSFFGSILGIGIDKNSVSRSQ
ncbi:glycosyltransferase [Candidatus Poribacteria bacterium]|nr:glycosyltransferase [Candidatus Poribacteria bacterium]